MQSIFSFFTDPLLRAPTVGCMLMCFSASLIGVIVVLRKQSLIGEALSHAAYPGILLGVILAAFFVEDSEWLFTLCTLTGAFFTSLLGLWCIRALENYARVPSDAALCFVLSSFFGVGVTLASEIQFMYTTFYQQALSYLYGQAATMTDLHILIYGCLSIGILCAVLMLYKELQIITFDAEYASSLGINVKWMNFFIYVLVTIAVVIGIRSVGVVLMSAMLIAPAITARQFTNRLSILFILSAFFGLTSGFLGNYFSIQFSELFANIYPSARLILPTGPMIVIVAIFFFLMALLFAPERGLLLRIVRVTNFRYTCICENFLKTMWRIHPHSAIDLQQIIQYQSLSAFYRNFILYCMTRNGWIEKEGAQKYRLTKDGEQRAAKIVRLHRLWEVYLADYLGMGAERVHRNAEEMEHIITPAIEKELTMLLHNPKKDPHHQPIPPHSSLYAE